VIETSGDFHHLPRWTTAAAGWLAESASVPTLGTQVTTIDLQLHIAGARLAFSRRLSVLAEGVEQSVLAEVSRAVSSLIEKAVIQGTGNANQPLGILNLPAKKTKTFSAATPTFAELSDMVELVGDADADLNQMVWVLHPSDLRDLLIAERVANTGEMILTWHEGRYRLFGMPVYSTTNCTEGKYLLGDMSTLNLVYFGPPQAIIDKFSGGKSTTGQTEVILLNMVDVGCTNEAAICVGTA
jgi:HK97 family phage major capsid protein